MSAERDNKQGITFIYNSFYHLYRQGKIESQSDEPVSKGKVLKTHTPGETPAPAEVRVIQAEQAEAWKKWAHHQTPSSSSPMSGMREHLRSLREAKSRLKFLSEELDEILKRAK